MLLASKLSNIWSTWISFLSLKTFGKCENEIRDRHILKIGQMCHLVWTCSSRGFLRLCKQTFFSLLSICSVAWMNLWVGLSFMKDLHKKNNMRSNELFHNHQIKYDLYGPVHFNVQVRNKVTLFIPDLAL